MRIFRSATGFTLIEVMLVMAILAVIGSFLAPSIMGLSERSVDVRSLSQTFLHSLERARTIARASQDDSPWGVHISSSTGIVLFKGSAYTSRDPTFDEFSIAIPSVVHLTSTLTTPTEVVFAKLTGELSVTGSVLFVDTTTNMQLRVWIDDATGGIYQDDSITICHHPGQGDQATMSILQSLLPSHTIHGDTTGPC